MDHDHVYDSKTIKCPICKSRISMDISVGIGIEIDNYEAVEKNRAEHEGNSDGGEPVTPYKPSIPTLSWFNDFFDVVDCAGKFIGLSEGKVLLFREELLDCFIKSRRKPVTLTEQSSALYAAIPSDSTECFPRDVSGKIHVSMIDSAGQVVKGFFFGRPGIDLAYWLCPEVRFFVAGNNGLMYMAAPDGSLLMVLSGIKNEKVKP